MGSNGLIQLPQCADIGGFAGTRHAKAFVDIIAGSCYITGMKKYKAKQQDKENDCCRC